MTAGGPRAALAARWRRGLAANVTARALHSFMGLTFSLLLLLVALTGTLSVFSLEIDWLAQPALRVAPGPEGKRPLGEVLDAASAARPDWRPIALQRYPGARFADQVTVAAPGEGQRLVWVDPYRVAVTGTGSVDTVRTTLRELHRAFSSRNALARLAVAALSLPLAVLVLAALRMSPRFWRDMARRPRLSGRRRAVLSDLHRLLGAWALPFLAVVVATTLVFLSEMLGLSMPMMPMAATAPREAPLPPGFAGGDLDRAVALAQAALPGLEVTDVLLPRSPTEPLSLRGPSGAVAVRDTASAVLVDPGTGQLLVARPAEAMGPRGRLAEAARVVHYGTVAGLPTRLLWALLGMAAVGAGVLGSMIYAERMLKQARGPDRGRGRWGLWWAGLGPGRWLGLAGLALAATLTARTLL